MRILKQAVTITPSFKPYNIVITVEDAIDEQDLKLAMWNMEHANKRGYLNNHIYLADKLRELYPKQLKP